MGGGRGKKAETRSDGDCLDWALDGFSGYLAADELHDGPYCVLSIVDHRSFKRIAFDNGLAKLTAPFERIMAFSLLGVGTVTRFSGHVLEGGGNRQGTF